MVFVPTAVQYVVCAIFLFLENERDVCTAVLRTVLLYLVLLYSSSWCIHYVTAVLLYSRKKSTALNGTVLYGRTALCRVHRTAVLYAHMP